MRQHTQPFANESGCSSVLGNVCQLIVYIVPIVAE